MPKFKSILVFALLQFAMVGAYGQLKVAFFLSPTCTICRFYALEMRSLSEDYGNKGVDFVGFAVGPLLNDSIVEAFRREYQIPFPIEHDDVMHRHLNAIVTPEVFVIHNDSIVYHGRIDDSFLRVGKRRAHVKNRELRSVLDSMLQGRSVDITFVPAVGCIIEK